jgi:hypothetical protein
LYKEELDAAKKQVERYGQKIVNLEIENKVKKNNIPSSPYNLKNFIFRN